MYLLPELHGGHCLAAGLALFASSALASTDECTDLRVTKEAAGAVRIEWTAPLAPTDSYNVRRCALPALHAGSYGICIATGIAPTTHVDPDDLGSVFYLASGNRNIREYSLGQAWDGTTYTDRVAPACGSPPAPRTVTIVVSLLDAVPVCGTEVSFNFPAGDVSFVSGMATGLQLGFAAGFAESPPGSVHGVCAIAQNPPTGPGELERITMQEGECPLPVGAYLLVQCDVVVDCATGVVEPHRCALELQ